MILWGNKKARSSVDCKDDTEDDAKSGNFGIFRPPTSLSYHDHNLNKNMT